MGCSPHIADSRCVPDATSLTATLRRGPNPLRGEAPVQRAANPLRILFLQKAAALEGRLRVAGDAEAAIRRSLESRRGLVVEVLAALQRMGLRPPPAVLVRPDDLLSALRTAMLLFDAGGMGLFAVSGTIKALGADLGILQAAVLGAKAKFDGTCSEALLRTFSKMRQG